MVSPFSRVVSHNLALSCHFAFDKYVYRYRFLSIITVYFTIVVFDYLTFLYIDCVFSRYGALFFRGRSLYMASFWWDLNVYR